MKKDQTRSYVIALTAAALVGIPVAAIATGFTTGIHDLETLFWTTIPNDMGYSEPPWWWVLLLPTVAGVITIGALRLPGHGGHSPAEGLSFQPAGPKLAAGTVLAATASLTFGIVLGPEAPLVAIGLALGTVAGRLASKDETMGAIIALAGGFAAIATVFGGPLASSLLLFEALSTSGKFPSAMLQRVLVPGLLAAGVGDVVFTGVRNWSGLNESKLTVPGLPHYGTLRLVDIGIAILVALVTAALVLVARRVGSETFHRVGGRALVLIGGGLAVGLVAVLFHEISGKAYDFVLFSGESSIGLILKEGSVAVIVGVLFAKALAYAISIGAGFRGGPVFPAIFIGVAVGTLATAIDSSFSITAGVAVGVAAAGAAGLRAPFFGALLATLLVGTPGLNATPLIVIGAVLAWLLALAVTPQPDAEPEVPHDEPPKPATA
jgi:H+/Cl- antiporter ClcA